MAAYINRSLMNNSVLSIVLRGFSKSNNSYQKWLTYPGCCVHVALFGSKVGQGMRNQLCDMLG